MLRIVRCALFVVGVALTASQSLAGDWPAFRGPRGDGTSAEKSAPTKWSATENVAWKFPLPAPGNSSPIVSQGRVFVTCAEAEGTKRSLYCLDRTNGQQVWVRTVEFDQKLPTHQTNPYCGSTPVADGERVVVWHSSAGLYCYDFDGKQLWSRQLGEFKHQWGYGTSPILYDGKVILHSGPGEREFVGAYDLASGETIWETDEPTDGNGQERGDGKYMGSWSTPIVANVDGQDQIVCSMPTRVNAYDPKSGAIVWSCDGIRGPKGDLAYSSPLVSDGFCVSTGGFGGPSIGFELGGSGNITDDRRAWRKETNPQSIGSGVYLGDYVYKPNAGPPFGLTCLEAKTGEILWEEGRGVSYWGSIVEADGNLYVTNQQGVTVVFKPNPEKYEEVAKNELGERSNSTPAISDGQIFIRTMEHVWCIGE